MKRKITAVFMTVVVLLLQLTTVGYAFSLGDVNGNGEIQASDARTALRASARLQTLNDEEKTAADANRDGEVTAADARIILRVAARLETLDGGETPDSENKKILVVYFTWSSNTERMAKAIGEQTGGDVLEIIPVAAYPSDYTACTEVALAERDNNARPGISNLPSSVDEYDAILIGYPIWWHTAPMIIGTFLENYDLTGIDVYPFTQSASMDRTQFNNSMDFVRSCAKNATVHDGLFARYSDTSAINEYLNNNNLMK